MAPPIDNDAAQAAFAIGAEALLDVCDAETVGLHGECFAVAWSVVARSPETGEWHTLHESLVLSADASGDARLASAATELSGRLKAGETIAAKHFVSLSGTRRRLHG